IPVKANARTILLCSPRKDLYRDFDKFGLSTVRFMPVWGRREIDECRDKIFYNIEKEKVEELFLKCGGIPSFVLEQADDKGYQDMLEKAINKCSMDIFKYVGESTDTDEMSHKLVHIYTNLPFADEVKDENEMDLDTIPTIPNDVMLDRHGEGPYTKTIVRFASEFVKQEVTKTLEEDIRSKLRTETNLSLKAGISNSLLGMSFEQIVHRLLRDGGVFKTRSLELNCLEEDLIINRQSEILELFKSNISVIEDGKYYKPVEQNYPMIDAIITPNKLFQMTISKIHPIKMNEHLYDNYRKQDFHTSNDTLALNVPLWIF
ncbi:8758_t:CDS:2, partial [Funneliformis mosseae]